MELTGKKSQEDYLVKMAHVELAKKMKLRGKFKFNDETEVNAETIKCDNYRLSVFC